MTAGNKLSRIIAAFFCTVLAFVVLSFLAPAREVYAAGSYRTGYRDTGDPDSKVLWINFTDYPKNTELNATLEVSKHEFYVNSVSGCSKSLVKGGDSKITISNLVFTKEVTIKITIRGTNVNGTKIGKVSVKAITPGVKSVSAKSSKKKKKTKKKNTSKKNSIKKTVLPSKTIVTQPSETTVPGVMLAGAASRIDGESPTPIPSEPSENVAEPVEANLNHRAEAKNKKSFVWLGFILLLIAIGLVYLRIRALINAGKHGKDIALDFIPGVGDIFYVIGGSHEKHAPIASDTQHGYMRNTAAAKKELKELEDAEKKAELEASRSQHAPIKRPKELSVNRATAINANASATSDPVTEATEAAAVAVGGLMFDNENKHPASPFKPLEGVEPVQEAKPDESLIPTAQHGDANRVMTSAFKPSAGAHNNTEKIVSSAFKPSSGAHNNSDKIVSSAFKSTNKFTPQKGPSSPSSTQSDALKLARERAEAAKQQQAMRAAMLTMQPGTDASHSEGVAGGFAPSGPVVSASRAKTSSNSNQLGNILAGKARNGGRTPVWAAPGAGVSPFKQTSEAQEEDAVAEAAGEEEPQAEVKVEAPVASYADTARTRKSAFFSRSSTNKDSSRNGGEGGSNAYSSIVRPSSAADIENSNKSAEPAIGEMLEGQTPSIMDPTAKSAPTAAVPVFGFKPADPASENP